MTLQQVRNAALTIETRLADRGSLRNMKRLMPLFSGLENYADVMGLLCNGTPYLSWLWAPITLVLRVASEYVEAFEVLAAAYSRLAEALPRFNILGKAFPRDAEFQQTLAVYYSDILAFHGQAYQFVHRSSWKLFFLTSWGRFQRRFDALVENMKNHERLVDCEASARNIAESQAFRAEMREARKRHEESLAEEEQETAANQFAALLSWLKADDADQLAIFEAIDAEGRRFDGTCSWLTKHRRIQAWMNGSPDTALLLVKGPPGTGKSVLAAQLVSIMRQSGKFVACHFCTYTYAGSTTYDQVLRSLLLQLLRRNPELVAYVYTKYVLTRTASSVTELKRLLESLVANFSASAGASGSSDCDPGKPSNRSPSGKREHVWIVFDGLDECTPATQKLVINLLRQLTTRSASIDRDACGGACSVLIASRNNTAINDRLRCATVVSLADEKPLIAGAIRDYARGRLEELHDRLSQLRVGAPELKTLVDTITAKADGMFLYARLVLDYISSNLFYSSQELQDSIDVLPAELLAFYRDILYRSRKNLDNRSVERMRCIFGWVAFSKRPLKKLEFMSAVTFSQGDPTVDHLVPQYILDATAPLVEERADRTIGFIHVSVKE